jgi:beta-lactamase class A
MCAVTRLAFAALLWLAASPAGACDGPFPLHDDRHPLLQANLASALRQAGLADALEREQLTVALVDLTWPDAIAYAGINDDRMLYAASLPKISILLALFESFARGEKRWEDPYRWKIGQMINVSSNAEATWAAEEVGLPEIGRVMMDPRYCLYQPGVGGLWAGRPFRKGGLSHREPLKQLSHAATARQAARFYVLLDRELLVSPHWSRYMRHVMSPPGYRHKFVGALEKRRGVRFQARKSGSWSVFHSDSALIEHDHVRYVLAALSEHPNGEALMRRVAEAADDVVMAGEHRSFRARMAARGR